MFVLWLASALFQQVSALEVSRRPVIAGNWKMNPSTIADAKELATAVGSVESDAEVVLFPPSPFLPTVKEQGLCVGAQDFYEAATSGAFTSAVSGPMLASLGVEYILAGHSERRTLFGEDDARVAAKVKETIDNKFKSMVCIGETREERDAGITDAVCALQLSKALAGVDAADASNVVIAYEPVWAIGTGLVCAPDVAQQTHAEIRACLASIYSEEVAQRTRILYGGSVTAESVDSIMVQPDIDGVLVGGASLQPDSFQRIIQFQFQAPVDEKNGSDVEEKLLTPV